ncbi:hypothetical protein EON65_03270, partial [archaeon]
MLNVEVSVKASKAPANNRDNSTIKVSLQVLLAMLAEGVEVGADNEDQSSFSPPTKRRRLEEQVVGAEEEGEDKGADMDEGDSGSNRASAHGVVNKSKDRIAYERCGVYAQCIASLVYAHVRHYNISTAHTQITYTGMFSYIRGFRKTDIFNNSVDDGINRNPYDVYMPVLLQRILPYYLKDGLMGMEEGRCMVQLYQSLVLLCIRKLFAQLSHSSAHQPTPDMFVSSQVLSPI